MLADAEVHVEIIDVDFSAIKKHVIVIDDPIIFGIANVDLM